MPNGGLNFILRSAIFVQKRVLYISALFFWELGYNKLNKFASLGEGRMPPPVLAQGYWLKSGSLPLLSLVMDALMVRECCWWFEGKATQQIDQQIENRSDNFIFSTIIMHLPDTPSWQEIQIKPSDILCQGTRTAGYKTNFGSHPLGGETAIFAEDIAL